MTAKKWIKENYSTESIIIENIEFISEMLDKYVLSLSPKTHVPDTGNMVQEWISVNDAPKTQGEYLIYPYKYNKVAYFHSRGEYAGKWTIDDAFGYGCVINPLFWMPLPKAPSDK